MMQAETLTAKNTSDFAVSGDLCMHIFSVHMQNGIVKGNSPITLARTTRI